VHVCEAEIWGSVLHLAHQIRSKILVVGLDGATFDLIGPMMEEGKLPNLQKLASTGIHSKLRSTILPVSAIAWTSFSTGKNAGKHGIYDFSKRVAGTYDYCPTTSLDNSSASIWDVIGSAGGRSVVVNVPLTYPAKQINGVMISGFPTPSNVEDFIYPKALLPMLESILGRTVDIRKPPVLYSKGHEREITDKLIDITRHQTEITKALMQNLNWNLTVSVYDATDVLGHYFWAYLDRNHPKFDRSLAEPTRKMVEEIHIELDKAVGELIDSAGNDALVFVLSDHGFGPVYYGVYINNWLLERKYMYLKNSLRVKAKYWTFEHGLNTYNLLLIAKKFGLVKSIESAYSKRSKVLAILKFIALSMEDIDWTRTRVYSFGNFGQLYINLKGREPNGIVSKEEAEQLIMELMVELEGLNDPKTGKKMFDNIYKGDDIFNGSTDSPDIVFFDDEMKYSAHRIFELGSNRLITPHPIYSGNHKMDGVLFAAGNGIKSMPEAPSAEPQIIDLAPTILHCLGSYIPNDMDGRVLEEFFESRSEVANRRIEFALEEPESLKVMQSTRKPNAGRLFSREEQENVEQRLRDLGYL
jgi:predicted AlkP superfamily phosphohydrolase/phosphomutase